MGFIRTLHGDISKEKLGFTYSHEHIVCRPAYWQERGEDDLLLDDKEKSKLDVLDFKQHGGRSIVDATAIDYGRDVQAVQEIAIETGIHIVGTAGFNKSFLWDAKIKEELKPLIGHYETYAQWIEAKASTSWRISSSGRWKKGWRERLSKQARLNSGQAITALRLWRRRRRAL